MVCPLHPSAGFSYLLTIVDGTTRWPEAIPFSDIMAITCAKALVGVWISCFEIPLDMTSDREAQFTSAIWNNVAYLLGYCCVVSTHSLDPCLWGGGPIIPLLVHQPENLSIWPAAPSVQQSLSTNPWVTVWCVCGCS